MTRRPRTQGACQGSIELRLAAEAPFRAARASQPAARKPFFGLVPGTARRSLRKMRLAILKTFSWQWCAGVGDFRRPGSNAKRQDSYGSQPDLICWNFDSGTLYIRALIFIFIFINMNVNILLYIRSLSTKFQHLQPLQRRRGINRLGVGTLLECWNFGPRKPSNPPLSGESANNGCHIHPTARHRRH